MISAGCNNVSRHTMWYKPHNQVAKNMQLEQGQKHTLIVFVHGTILPLPSPSCIFPAIKDVLKKGRREKKGWSDYYYEKLRYNTFFKYQIISNYGLKRIDEQSEGTCVRYPYTNHLANLYENSYEFANSKIPTNLHIYSFGWDGRLSHKSRQRSAKALYARLIEEIDFLKKSLNLSDDKIETILIGHSHGGNVLLNLVKAEEEFKQNLKIDKLILIGAPVQSETADLITNSMFKKVYSFYSNGDYVQVVDIVSTEDSISKRRFKNNEANSRLTQVELTVDKTKPSHSELWLLGDTYDFIHRKSLTTYPLPLFIFIPIIINSIEEQASNCHEILANIRRDKKEQEFVVKIKNKGTDKLLEQVIVPTERLES